MKKAVIVTGTPGTGKTTLAKRLAKKFGHKYVDVNNIIKKEKLSEGYDRKRKCRIVDEKKLAKSLERLIKRSREKVVIDSHLSHHISPRFVKLCVVTKCSLKNLYNRLKKKGYEKKKIDENMECEIMDICLNEALERGHKIKIIETNKKCP